MLFILLNWLYIFITTMITGYGILYVIRKAFGWTPLRIYSYVRAGLVVFTAYSVLFSFFYQHLL